jgi:hypothetical protein
MLEGTDVAEPLREAIFARSIPTVEWQYHSTD